MTGFFNNHRTQSAQRVLILGDSFAVKHTGYDDADTGNGPSWTMLLESDPRFKITNMAEGGSGMWFSFRNFMKYHHEYDVILYVVSESHRLYHPISTDSGIRHWNFAAPWWFDAVRRKLSSHSLENTGLQEVLAIELYFKHLLDTEERDTFQRLMINDIRTVRPDAILIPAFRESIYDHNGTCLIDISDREIHHLGLRMADTFKTRDERRLCHMTKENNRTLYEHAVRWIDGENISMHMEDFGVISAAELDRYMPVMTPELMVQLESMI